MRILIAPAKKMISDIPYLNPTSYPVFLNKTKLLMYEMQKKTIDELKCILNCSDRIAIEAQALFQDMCLTQGTVPAILAYQGIQYHYMAPQIFTDEYFAYVQKHVRILSGFYGVLKPLDGVVPYRLELNNALKIDGYSSLYAFWKHYLYNEIVKDTNIILDLASVQYSKAIRRYKQNHIRYVTCSFKEAEQGRLREKGVYVKIARGEMVRFLAERHADNLEEVKLFNRCGYCYQASVSTENNFVFVRRSKNKTS